MRRFSKRGQILALPFPLHPRGGSSRRSRKNQTTVISRSGLRYRERNLRRARFKMAAMHGSGIGKRKLFTRAILLSGAGAAAIVIATTILGWDELLTRYHVSKLHRDPTLFPRWVKILIQPLDSSISVAHQAAPDIESHRHCPLKPLKTGRESRLRTRSSSSTEPEMYASSRFQSIDHLHRALHLR